MSSEQPSLVTTGKGHSLKYKNRYLYSSVDPAGSVRKRLESLSIAERTLVFLPSVGLGYGLADLLKSIPDSCHVLCVEVDQALMAFAARHAPDPWPRSSRLTILRSDSVEQIASLLRSLGVPRFRRVRTVILCGGYRIYRPLYDAMALALEEEIQTYWQNKMTLIYMGRLWMKNLLLNLPAASRSPDLATLRVDLPVLVVGAGSSLEGSLPLVRKVRERIFILAVDTALGTLLEAGLKPDLVLALDAQLVNLLDFIGPPLGAIPLICDVTTAPGVVRLFRKRTIFVASSFHNLSIVDRLKGCRLYPASIPPLGSVGVAAVHIALAITKGPVIMTGLDFSYSRNRTHCRGSPIGRLMLQTSTRMQPIGQTGYEIMHRRPLLKLTDKQGRPVTSDLVMHSYAGRLNKIAEDCSRLYDLGAEGLATGATRLETERDLCSLLPEEAPADRDAGLRFSDLLRREELAGTASEGPELPRCPGEGEPALKEFIEDEKHRLTQAIGLLEGFLSRSAASAASNAAAAGGERTQTPLAAVDYIHFFFPESEIPHRSTRSFYARALVSARYFHGLWQRVAVDEAAFLPES